MYEIFEPLTTAVARVLAFFYSLPLVGGSYDYAIILLTLAVMVLLAPLTIRATRSTLKMAQAQPKLKEIQREFKDDKKRYNEEVLKLYRQEGISPVGGCLPILAQMPVFLVLFQVLRGLARRLNQIPYYHVSDQVHSMLGLSRLQGESFEPQYLSHDSDLYKDLVVSDAMTFGPFDLGRSAQNVFGESFIKVVPYLLLILFVVFSSYYQQRQIQARRPNSKNTALSQQQQMQQQMQQVLMKILPIGSGIWSFAFPAGLVLYWATSNMFRIGQQAYITRAMYGDESEFDHAPVESSSKPKVDKEGLAVKQIDEGDTDTDISEGVSTSDTRSNSSDAARRRQDQWQQMRAQRSNRSKTNRTDNTQSRVTPKGTKSSQAKKKRK